MAKKVTKTVFGVIESERKYQDVLWGEQNHTEEHWLAILTEEVGEVARAILEYDSVYEEIVQVAAVAVAWLEALERQYEKPGSA